LAGQILSHAPILEPEMYVSDKLIWDLRSIPFPEVGKVLLDVVSVMLRDKAIVWRHYDSVVAVDEWDEPVCKPIWIRPSPGNLAQSQQRHSWSNAKSQNLRILHHGT
jgi:hypothetical protein